MRRSSWVLFTVDIGIKLALLALLALAVLFPDLPQFEGKAMEGRVLTYGIAMLVVPGIWVIRFRSHPYPVVIDILIALRSSSTRPATRSTCTTRSSGGMTRITSSTGG
jgi:hypothetical protein